MNEKKYTNREWIFVLIIISLAQTIIWYVSFINAKNASALNYVSFAGTLVSIILAVLAIGYTYGESVSQKTKANDVAFQIALLNEVVKSIKIESQSLSDISKISSELTSFQHAFNAKLSSTEKKVNEVHISINDFINNNVATFDDKINVLANSSDKAEFCKEVIETRTHFSEICLLFIGLGNNRTVKQAISGNAKYYLEYVKEKYDDLDIGFLEAIFEGYMGGTAASTIIFRTFGLITKTEDDNFSVSNELIDEIKKITIQEPKDSDKHYLILRSLLINEFTQTV